MELKLNNQFTKKTKKKKKTMSTKLLVKVSILSVLAFVIMMLELPLVIFPGFLKLDFSDLPALIASFSLGPVAGVLVQLIKNFIHFIIMTKTGGVGELANFIIGAALVIPSGIIYKKHKNKKGALLGMSLGIIAMTIVGALANYYILLPFYAKIMPMEAVINMASKVNSLIVDVKTLILYAIVPFNIIKGIIVAGITTLIYKKISPIINRI